MKTYYWPAAPDMPIHREVVRTFSRMGLRHDDLKRPICWNKACSGETDALPEGGSVPLLFAPYCARCASLRDQQAAARWRAWGEQIDAMAATTDDSIRRQATAMLRDPQAPAELRELAADVLDDMAGE